MSEYTPEQYVRHAKLYGDPRTVFEAAAEDLPPGELARLAAMLRRLGRIPEGRDRCAWPAFRLTEAERSALARRLLAAGYESKRIARLLGCSIAYLGNWSDSLETGPITSARKGPVTADSVVGRRFGLLEVLSIAANKHGNKTAVCRCECGSEKTVQLSHLRSGRTKSCGCLRRRQVAEMRDRILSELGVSPDCHALPAGTPAEGVALDHELE